ncbi:hypothetical protein M8J76_007253 [Diaphorina citri]|nr:hypothetical protein M8J76_007253 [Diaphorina citri]
MATTSNAQHNETTRLSGSFDSGSRTDMYGSTDSFNLQTCTTSTWTLQMEEQHLLQRQKKIVLTTLLICVVMIATGIGIPVVNQLI